MLDENKTLTECKIKDNYVIHAIFKKNIQNSQENNENFAPELEPRKCRIIIFPKFTQYNIYKENINQLAELLQRAAAFRQQVPRNNHNDVDPPQPRPNLRRQGLFDNRADMYNPNEDDQNN